jgi:imidazolonepropionase-like amidohydrolase
MSETTVLLNGTLIDGTGADPKPSMAVVVEGKHITKVASARRFRPPADARVIDVRGMCVLPGLIDAHVHLAAIGTDIMTEMRKPAAVIAMRIRQVIEATLDAGFTTVRDAGMIDSGFSAAVEEGYMRGPRILPSGAALSQTGGHGDWRPRFIDDLLEGVPGLVALSAICDGVDAVRRAARQQLRRGATQIKLIASGGAMSPTDEIDSSQFTVEEMAAAVYEAHAAGRYAMAHAYGPTAIRNALESGVLSIEHGNFLDEETAAAMKARGAYLVPTLVTYEMLDRFGEAGHLPEFNWRKIRYAKERAEEGVRIALAAGVPIGSGSDLLGPMQPLKTTELTLKARIMGNMAAIVSATATNAQLLRLAERTGTVQEGKWADLIVVAGNPADDVAVLESADNVRLVMKEGQILKDRLS